MLHTIGTRASPPTTELVDLLLACHGRIREHLALARRFASTTDAPLEEIVDTARRIHRYFAVALPLHVEDEEETIAPHLVHLGVEVEVALNTVLDEHAAHRPLLDWLLVLLDRVASAPARLPELRPMLSQIIDVLAPLLEVHLELEERVVFPALRRLPSQTRAEIHAAMRARRNGLSARAGR